MGRVHMTGLDTTTGSRVKEARLCRFSAQNSCYILTPLSSWASSTTYRQDSLILQWKKKPNPSPHQPGWLISQCTPPFYQQKLWKKSRKEGREGGKSGLHDSHFFKIYLFHNSVQCSTKLSLKKPTFMPFSQSVFPSHHSEITHCQDAVLIIRFAFGIRILVLKP